MVLVKDVNSEELIRKTAERLEKMPEFKPPSWAVFVKTGTHKERPPNKMGSIYKELSV